MAMNKLLLLAVVASAFVGAFAQYTSTYSYSSLISSKSYYQYTAYKPYDSAYITASCSFNTCNFVVMRSDQLDKYRHPSSYNTTATLLYQRKDSYSASFKTSEIAFSDLIVLIENPASTSASFSFKIEYTSSSNPLAPMGNILAIILGSVGGICCLSICCCILIVACCVCCCCANKNKNHPTATTYTQFNDNMAPAPAPSTIVVVEPQQPYYAPPQGVMMQQPTVSFHGATYMPPAANGSQQPMQMYPEMKVEHSVYVPPPLFQNQNL